MRAQRTRSDGQEGLGKHRRRRGDRCGRGARGGRFARPLGRDDADQHEGNHIDYGEMPAPAAGAVIDLCARE